LSARGDRREPTTFFNVVTHIDNDSAWLYGETTDPQSRAPQFAWRYDLKRSGFMESFVINLNSADKLGDRRTNNMPNDDVLKFPLEVGKQWSVKEAWGNGRGYTEYKAKVEAFEKIRVEAGEFESFKVTLKGFWTRTVDGGGSGRAERVIWYSPEVKRDVKRTFENRTPGGQSWDRNESELTKWESKSSIDNYPVVGVRGGVVPAASAPASAAPVAN